METDELVQVNSKKEIISILSIQDTLRTELSVIALGENLTSIGLTEFKFQSDCKKILDDRMSVRP